MKITMALLYKFLVTLLASWASFNLIDQNSINMILMISLTGTVINYILGDLYILPSMGNVIASIADGILAAAIAYMVDIFSYNFVASATSLIVFASIIAGAEYFFHIHLLKDDKVSPNEFHREHPLE